MTKKNPDDSVREEHIGADENATVSVNYSGGIFSNSRYTKTENLPSLCKH